MQPRIPPVTQATRTISRASWSTAPRLRLQHVALAAPGTARPRLDITADSGLLPPKSVAGFLGWQPTEPVSDVIVNGFVRSVRSMKAYTFVALGDGSSLASLQAVVPAHLADGIANGAAVRLKGSWQPSPAKGQSHELQVNDVQVLGLSDAQTFPIQKKYQTPEFLRTLPHLRPRIPFNTTLLRFRSDVILSLNQFFAERSFVQTHPPLITSSDCEGAGEVFTISPASSSEGKHKQVTDDSRGSQTGDGTLFFRAPKYLTVSTQLHLEALAQAVGNVWTLSPTFRAEESDTPRHLSEFYMLEAEASFVDKLDGIIDLVEDMVRSVAVDNFDGTVYHELLQRTKGNGGKDLASPEDVQRRWQGLMKGPWPRLTYTKAIEILASAPVKFKHAPTWGADLQTEHEKYLASTVGGGDTPVFITHYPQAIKAFYMLSTPIEAVGDVSDSSQTVGNPSDTPAPRAVVDCFDLLVPDFCEIAGGSMREHRLAKLLDAMQSKGLPLPASPDASDETGNASSTAKGDLDWYVDLRRWGCPPHGGFGVGFDRLLCYMSGVQTIRDTVAFPRWFGRCDC